MHILLDNGSKTPKKHPRPPFLDISKKEHNDVTQFKIIVLQKDNLKNILLLKIDNKRFNLKFQSRCYN